MVRHGQSEANAHKIVSGANESPLTDLGRQQAREAGQGAHDLGIDLIVCSPLTRAKETARIIANQIGYDPAGILVVPMLVERNLGELEGQSYTQDVRITGNYPDAEQRTGVEPIEQFHQRITEALQEILQVTSHNILIVCHINVGRMLRTIADNQEPMRMYEQPRLENGIIYRLK